MITSLLGFVFGAYLFNCFFLLEWWKIIAILWLAGTASPEWVRPQLLNRSHFFKLFCCNITESWKSSKPGLMCHGLWTEQRAELITQHEHSCRLKCLGFLAAEYCLRQVSGTGEQREGAEEKTAKHSGKAFTSAWGSKGHKCLCLVPRWSWKHRNLLCAPHLMFRVLISCSASAHSEPSFWTLNSCLLWIIIQKLGDIMLPLLGLVPSSGPQKI